MNVLGDTQRKLLLLVALHRRQHGIGPSWGWLGWKLHMPRGEVVTRLDQLRVHGYVTWEAEVPGSTDVTRRGVAAATWKGNGA